MLIFITFPRAEVCVCVYMYVRIRVCVCVYTSERRDDGTEASEYARLLITN